MSTTLRYVTQCRLMHGEKVLRDWSDVCAGHSDFDEAMVCHAESEQTDVGNFSNDAELIKLIMQAQWREMKRRGWRSQSRLIKRTITDEVVDA